MASSWTTFMAFLLTAGLAGMFLSMPVSAGEPAGQLVEGFLYFAERGGTHLKARPWQFPADTDSHGLARKILDALLAGPMDPDLESAWPRGTGVRAFFMADDGRAWVDLSVEEWKPNGIGIGNTDTLSELLAVYSVVNSLTLNIPEVRQVKILVNGSDVASLGGHVSLDDFFTTNMLIVK